LTDVSFAQRVSDDRGEYRAFQLPPGEYLVVAAPDNSPARASGSKDSGPRIVLGNQADRDPWPQTFYPAAADKSAATPVELKAGDDARGINIQLRSPNGCP